MEPESLQFITPPECQGQAVTYSYASHTDGYGITTIVRRCTQHGEPTIYERFTDPEEKDEYSTNLEYWNREPNLGDLLESWEEEA